MEDEEETTPFKGNSPRQNTAKTANDDSHTVNIEASTENGGNVNPSAAGNKQEDNGRSLCGFLGFIILLIILPVSVIIGLYIRPPDFQLKSLSVSSLSLSTGELTAHWNISFYVKSPEKGVNLFYDGIRVSLLYEDEFISATNIASFYQGIGEQLWMNATLGGSPVQLNPWIISAIDADMSLRKEIILSVVVDARVSQNPGSKIQQRLWMKVFCDYIKVKFSAETEVGSMAAGDAVSCEVNIE